MRRALIVVLIVGFAVGLGPPATAQSHDVTIRGVSAGFDPSTLSVALGDDVRWTNADMIDHTSTEIGGLALWNSGAIDGGDQFSFTFTAAGSFPYHCTIHSTMHGKVRVLPQASLLSNGTIRVVVASQALGNGLVVDVQRRDGNGGWQPWRDGLSRRSVRFDPQGDGRFSFRARLRRASGGASQWSPAVTVNV